MNIDWISTSIILSVQTLAIFSLVLMLYARKGNHTANYFLAAKIGAAVFYNLVGLATFTGFILNAPFLFRLDSPVHYLNGPLVYFYIRSSLYWKYRPKLWEWLLFLPAALHAIELMPLFTMGTEQKIEQIRYLLYVNKNFSLPYHSDIKYYFTLLIYLVAVGMVIHYFTVSIKYHIPQNKSYTSWICTFLIIYGMYFLHGFWVPLIPDLFQHSPYVYRNLVASLINSSICLFLLFFPQFLYGAQYEPSFQNTIDLTPSELKHPEVDETTDSPVKYKSSTLDDNQKKEYYKLLQDYMKKEQPFLNKNTSLHELAYNMDISAPHLSQIINEMSGNHFFDFINSYRVEHVKGQLTKEKLEKMTIIGLSIEAGFKSKATFYNAFKKFTGMTPTEFINKQQIDASTS